MYPWNKPGICAIYPLPSGNLINDLRRERYQKE
jgi:hypothetical protein